MDVLGTKSEEGVKEDGGVGDRSTRKTIGNIRHRAADLTVRTAARNAALVLMSKEVPPWITEWRQTEDGAKCDTKGLLIRQVVQDLRRLSIEVSESTKITQVESADECSSAGGTPLLNHTAPWGHVVQQYITSVFIALQLAIQGLTQVRTAPTSSSLPVTAELDACHKRIGELRAAILEKVTGQNPPPTAVDIANSRMAAMAAPQSSGLPLVPQRPPSVGAIPTPPSGAIPKPPSSVIPKPPSSVIPKPPSGAIPKPPSGVIPTPPKSVSGVPKFRGGTGLAGEADATDTTMEGKENPTLVEQEVVTPPTTITSPPEAKDGDDREKPVPKSEQASVAVAKVLQVLLEPEFDITMEVVKPTVVKDKTPKKSDTDDDVGGPGLILAPFFPTEVGINAAPATGAPVSAFAQINFEKLQNVAMGLQSVTKALQSWTHEELAQVAQGLSEFRLRGAKEEVLLNTVVTNFWRSVCKVNKKSGIVPYWVAAAIHAFYPTKCAEHIWKAMSGEKPSDVAEQSLGGGVGGSGTIWCVNPTAPKLLDQSQTLEDLMNPVVAMCGDLCALVKDLASVSEGGVKECKESIVLLEELLKSISTITVQAPAPVPPLEPAPAPAPAPEPPLKPEITVVKPLMMQNQGQDVIDALLSRLSAKLSVVEAKQKKSKEVLNKVHAIERVGTDAILSLWSAKDGHQLTNACIQAEAALLNAVALLRWLSPPPHHLQEFMEHLSRIDGGSERKLSVVPLSDCELHVVHGDTGSYLAVTVPSDDQIPDLREPPNQFKAHERHTSTILNLGSSIKAYKTAWSTFSAAIGAQLVERASEMQEEPADPSKEDAKQAVLDAFSPLELAATSVKTIWAAMGEEEKTDTQAATTSVATERNATQAAVAVKDAQIVRGVPPAPPIPLGGIPRGVPAPPKPPGGIIPRGVPLPPALAGSVPKVPKLGGGTNNSSNDDAFGIIKHSRTYLIPLCAVQVQGGTDDSTSMLEMALKLIKNNGEQPKTTTSSLKNKMRQLDSEGSSSNASVLTVASPTGAVILPKAPAGVPIPPPPTGAVPKAPPLPGAVPKAPGIPVPPGAIPKAPPLPGAIPKAPGIPVLPGVVPKAPGIPVPPGAIPKAPGIPVPSGAVPKAPLVVAAGVPAPAGGVVAPKVSGAPVIAKISIDLKPKIALLEKMALLQELAGVMYDNPCVSTVTELCDVPRTQETNGKPFAVSYWSIETVQSVIRTLVTVLHQVLEDTNIGRSTIQALSTSVPPAVSSLTIDGKEVPVRTRTGEGSTLPRLKLTWSPSSLREPSVPITSYVVTLAGDEHGRKMHTLLYSLLHQFWTVPVRIQKLLPSAQKNDILGSTICPYIGLDEVRSLAGLLSIEPLFPETLIPASLAHTVAVCSLLRRLDITVSTRQVPREWQTQYAEAISAKSGAGLFRLTFQESSLTDRIENVHKFLSDEERAHGLKLLNTALDIMGTDMSIYMEGERAKQDRLTPCTSVEEWRARVPPKCVMPGNWQSSFTVAQLNRNTSADVKAFLEALSSTYSLGVTPSYSASQAAGNKLLLGVAWIHALIPKSKMVVSVTPPSVPVITRRFMSALPPTTLTLFKRHTRVQCLNKFGWLFARYVQKWKEVPRPISGKSPLPGRDNWSHVGENVQFDLKRLLLCRLHFEAYVNVRGDLVYERELREHLMKLDHEDTEKRKLLDEITRLIHSISGTLKGCFAAEELYGDVLTVLFTPTEACRDESVTCIVSKETISSLLGSTSFRDIVKRVLPLAALIGTQTLPDFLPEKFGNVLYTLTNGKLNLEEKKEALKNEKITDWLVSEWVRQQFETLVTKLCVAVVPPMSLLTAEPQRLLNDKPDKDGFCIQEGIALAFRNRFHKNALDALKKLEISDEVAAKYVQVWISEYYAGKTQQEDLVRLLTSSTLSDQLAAQLSKLASF